MKTIKVRSNNIFFTSDLHFWHNNIIKYCNRPCNNVDEMHELIIKNWNNKISNRDTVFILGDITFKGMDKTAHILDQLNGTKIFIAGNHDGYAVATYFGHEHDMLGVEVTDDETGVKTYCHLSHFPLLSWNRDKHGSINIHGHVHKTENVVDGKRIDVGMDGHNLTPWSWSEIKEAFKNAEDK